MRNRQPQGFHFLRQPGDAHRVLVDAFTDDPEVGAELIDGEFLIGKRLARRGGLFIDARIDRLQRGGQLLDRRLQLLLELLRLLLQHADVGHHLHLAARLRGGRAGQQREPTGANAKPAKSGKPQVP